MGKILQQNNKVFRIGNKVFGLATLPPYTYLGRISGNEGPYGLVLDRANNRFFIANVFDGSFVNKVSIANLTTLAITDSFSSPSSADVALYNGNLYVTSYNNNAVYIYDANTKALLTTVSGNMNNPLGIRIDAVNDRYFVANAGSGTVTVIKLSDNTYLSTITGIGGASDLAIDSVNAKLYVSTNTSNLVKVLRLSDFSVEATINAGKRTRGITVDNLRSRLFVANSSEGTVQIYDLTSYGLLHTIPVQAGAYAMGIMLDPVANRFFVSGGDSSNHLYQYTYS